MSTTVSVKYTGLKEVYNALDKLPEEIGKRVIGKAVRSGVEIMRDAIKAEAPVGQFRTTGTHLKDSIIIRTKRKRGTTWGVNVGGEGARLSMYVGPSGRLAPHAHLVTGGTKPHVIEAGLKAYGSKKNKTGRVTFYKKTGKKVLASKARGIVFGPSVTVSARPNPFIRRAFDRTSRQSVNVIVDKSATGIEKAFAKLVRK